MVTVFRQVECCLIYCFTTLKLAEQTEWNVTPSLKSAVHTRVSMIKEVWCTAHKDRQLLFLVFFDMENIEISFDESCKFHAEESYFFCLLKKHK